MILFGVFALVGYTCGPLFAGVVWFELALVMIVCGLMLLFFGFVFLGLRWVA